MTLDASLDPRTVRSVPGWLVAITAAAWAAVSLTWFFSGLLWSDLWIFAAVIDIGLRAVALLLTTALVWRCARAGRQVAAFVAVVGVGLVMVVAYVVPWWEV